MGDRAADADRRLDELVMALRDTPRTSPLQHDATRRRVLETIDARSRIWRRRFTFAAIALTLGTGTMSWAATGGLDPLLTRIGLRAPAPSPASIEAPVVLQPPEPTTSRPAHVTLASLEQTMPPPVPVPAPMLPEAPPRPAPHHVAPAPAPADAADPSFRRAHDLHFHGTDAAAALAAWDDYLAAHAAGRLAVEARWNRALALVKLARHDDATAALAPFARGEVAPAGYRRAEAIALTEAIARHRARATDGAER